MKIAVLSDTHDNQHYMDLVISMIEEPGDIDMFCHLGDSYENGMDMLEKLDIDGLTVPGIYDDAYEDDSIENFCSREVFGRSVYFLHDPDDYGPDQNHDIVLYGHTHKPASEYKANTWFINPGHLKDDTSKGYAPTFGVLTDGGDCLTFTWFHPAEQPVLCRRITLD